jgi:hypothetical protein
MLVISCVCGFVLLLAGIAAISFDDREGWLYIGGSAVAFLGAILLAR